MLNVSKNFKNDIVSTNQPLKPVLVITDSNDNVLFTLTQDKEELFDVDGNLIRSISTISKVSNIKVSSDYDKKTLKINTLRFTLYNYYDVNTKLSEHINYNLINKQLYLLYKSPSTDRINLTPTYDDRECALVYRGEISRINIKDDTIDITAEDKTQRKIADKDVPYMSVERLPISIRERILSEYKDDNITMPMTFGKVDKAPVLPYETEYSNRTLDIVFDVHPTGGYFKTFKIPSVAKDDLPIGNNYYLYFKSDKDYIIWEHQDLSYNYQSLSYSMVKILSNFAQVDNYVIPELQIEAEGLQLWDMKGIVQRQAISAYAGDSSIIDISNITINDIDEQDIGNTEKLNDNRGHIKRWYRDTDTLASATGFTSGNVFSFPTRTYNPTTYNSGAGRWILLKLDTGVNNDLRNTYYDGNWIGNTFLAGDVAVLQSYDGSIPNDTSLFTEITGTGWFVSPIATNVWKELVPTILSQADTDANKWRRLLNALLITDEEQLSNATPNTNTLLNLISTNTDPFASACLFLERDVSNYEYGKYFGNSALFWKKVNGMYYGDIGSDDNVVLSNGANEHKYIAMFEFYPSDLEMWNREYTSGVEIDNLGFIQTINVPDAIEEEIYASIIGRKNNYYTEQIEANPIVTDFEATLELIIGGEDGTLPDFNILLNNRFDIISNIPFGVEVGEINYAEGQTFPFLEIDQIPEIETMFNQFFDDSIDDSVLNTNLPLFKNVVYAIYRDVLRMWNYIHSQLYIKNLILTSDTIYENEGIYGDWYTYNDIVPESWEDLPPPQEFLELCFESMKSETFIKSICKRVYEYLYQTDIGYEYDWAITHINPHWIQNNPPNLNQYSLFWYASELTWDTSTVDISFDYSYTDFDIQNRSDLFNNLGAFLDDTLDSINSALYNGLASIITVPNWTTTGWGGLTYSHSIPNRDDLFDAQPELFLFTENETNLYNIGLLEEDLSYAAYLLSTSGESTTTAGIIELPSDIIMNILTYDMGYGRREENQLIENNDPIAPDYEQFDLESIELSRAEHMGWKMGFSINELTNGKDLIENILSETKSYPTFHSDGKFGLITLKNAYAYEDIDKTINVNDVLSFSFSQTKKEDIITSLRYYYRYDNGQDNYSIDVLLDIQSLLPEYELTGYEYYGIEQSDGYKEIKFRYHTDTNTAQQFAEYKLLNNCNVHNKVDLKLPLNYVDLQVGDIIYMNLINNEVVFDVDYSKVSYLNGQPVYPLWVVMETNVGVDSISIKAYQLHYLGTDGNHGFALPDSTYDIIGNINEYNTQGYDGIKNWNFNPLATVHNDYEIPYGDINGDGVINVIDIIALINHIVGAAQLTSFQIERLPNNDGIINILDIIELVNIVVSDD